MKKTEENDSTIESVKSRTKNNKTDDSMKSSSSETKISKESEKMGAYDKLAIAAVFIIAIVVLFNQFQIQTVSSNIGVKNIFSNALTFSGESNLKDLELPPAQSTGHTIALVMDVNKITDSQSAIDVMVPTGTPEYGEAMGVTFDDPITALDKLAKAYPALNAQIKENPELWNRYINLGSNNYGISCEYCCGVGPAGITKSGSSKCGCAYNPALLSVTQWLLLNTEYSDAEILREVMRWKTLFFPRDMVNLAVEVAGGDTSSLDAIPAMVGGC